MAPSPHGTRPESRIRWPVCLLLAILLLATAADRLARFYPEGDLALPDDLEPGGFIVMMVPPEIEIEPEPDIAPDDPPVKPPPPPISPDPDPLAAALQERLLVIVDDLWQTPEPTADTPTLALPPRHLVFHTLADTTARLLPLRARLLFDAAWERDRVWIPSLTSSEHSQRFYSNQRSIFNEDWLSGEVLK